MSYFEDASLVYIPSAVKDGKTYSIKPTDGSGDLTFSRGSDIEATRISADGLIQKAQVNLLLQSNTFSTTWATTSATVTSGQAGYDGTNDAWLLEKFTATGRVTQSLSLSGLYSISVYAKKGTLDGLRIRFDGTTIDGDVYFDLASGTIGNNASSIDAQIQSVGGGWYRCSLSQNNAFTLVRFYPSDASTLSSSTGTIYIQDAQLNYGLVAQTYQETTTAAVVSGITDNMPRLNYDPANPTCPSLLLEGSRTNLITQSEYYGGSEWTKTNATITTNATTSPEGVANASKYEGTNATNYLQRITTAANGTYTFSIFVKKDATDVFRMNLSDGVTGEIRYLFNLSTEAETLTKSGGSISDYSAGFEAYQNGWYRLHITATTNSGSTVITYVEADNQTGSYFLYGAQLESGSYVSSMVPTYGSSATRTAEACSKTGISSLIGQTEGVLYFEGTIEGVNSATTRRIFSLSDGTNANYLVVYNPANTRGLDFVTAIGGAVQCNITSSSTLIQFGQRFKLAIAYAQNDFAFYVNGVQIGIDGNGNVPSPIDKFVFGRGDDAALFEGTNSQLLLFTSRLSNADLATLTSL